MTDLIPEAERIRTIAWAMQRLLERNMEPSGALVARLSGYTVHRVAKHWAEAMRELKISQKSLNDPGH